jgi:hypothetical protein
MGKNEMSTHRGLLHHVIIVVSNVSRSSPFYGAMFRYLDYELSGSSERHEDWTRWDLDTPHEISIVQASEKLLGIQHVRGAVGHHHHLAFCAADRNDVDRFYSEVLLGLASKGLCTIEDPPCECPEYGEGYYATFFKDYDGLKYEFVVNESWMMRKRKRAERSPH